MELSELKKEMVMKRQVMERKINNIRLDYPRIKDDIDILDCYIEDYTESLKRYYDELRARGE